jgi:signal transduction histidine kinase
MIYTHLDGPSCQQCIEVQPDSAESKSIEDCFHQSQKIAAIGWLAAGLAHDFNNILTAILGHCNMLLASPRSWSMRDGLAAIRTAGERGALLTGQLLALTHREFPMPGVVDLSGVLKSMGSVLRALSGEAIELVTIVDPALGLVKAAPGQMEQVLLNLVVNARDAMPTGGTITIEASNACLEADPDREEPPARYVRLAVIDDGCGMSEEVRAGLFRPLFTTKGPGKGSGLGLFTVHEIVTRNGGIIRVSSQEGRGSMFEIYLPRCDEELGR